MPHPGQRYQVHKRTNPVVTQLGYLLEIVLHPFPVAKRLFVRQRFYGDSAATGTISFGANGDFDALARRVFKQRVELGFRALSDRCL